MRTQNDFQVVILEGRPAIRGDCDFAAAREIESWLMTLEPRPLEIDLSAVTFFDSTALQVFLNARRRNPYIRVVNPSDPVQRVLEITGTYAGLVEGPRGLAGRTSK
jgi:anti-anti-sigma factor